MNNSFSQNLNAKIPEGFMVFISGVPGVGKTTISYELLKMFDEFRIIEETDLVREILRGYNEYIRKEFGNKLDFLFEEIDIANHMKFLSFNEAKEQCEFMKMSFEKIVSRQQRKGIPSIINGVHIIPEILNGIANNNNLIFINLYINNEKILSERFKNRDSNKYALDNIPLIYQTNIELYQSTQKLIKETTYVFNNIDVTSLSIEETITQVVNCIYQRVGKNG